MRFEADLERAVSGVDLVQENGPEKPEWKQQLWARIEKAVPAHALLLSSSSARPATEQGSQMQNASRLLVGHPFNPPHLIPLVEVVPGEHTDPRAVEPRWRSTPRSARCRACSRKKSRVSWPTGCNAPSCARPAIWCKRAWSRSMRLDDIVTSSIGMRWAVNGPFSSFHMGGGPGGLAAFTDGLGKNMVAAWKKVPTVEMDDVLRERIISQTAASFGRFRWSRWSAPATTGRSRCCARSATPTRRARRSNDGLGPALTPWAPTARKTP